MRFLYNILIALGLAAGLPVILPTAVFSEKRRKTVLYRLGLRSVPGGVGGGRTGRRPIWVHALSVGEVLSAAPLLDRLKMIFSDRPLVLSVSTRTGFEIAKSTLARTVDRLVYYPYDFPLSVRRVVKGVDPELMIIVETDIWPNFLAEMNRRRVPVILVNARLSPRTFAGYRRLSFFIRPVLGMFSHICVQSEAEAERFRRLGVSRRRLSVTGNIKFDQIAPGPSAARQAEVIARLRFAPADKVFLAGSTHPGEESTLSVAFRAVRNRLPHVHLLVVPRDPARADAVVRLFRADGFTVRLLNGGASEAADVIVVGRMGLLRQLYAVSDLAFIGGSLVSSGGHNPLEAAAFSKPVLFGPDMSDFPAISRMLLEAGGAFRVRSARELASEALRLLTDDRDSREAGERAFGVFSANQGAVDRTLTVIGKYPSV